MANRSHMIPEHWDTGGEITADSDPIEEFRLWQQHAVKDPEWERDTLTLADFENYIQSLKDDRR